MTPEPMLIAEFASAIKPRMRRKCAAAPGKPRRCVKLRAKTANELHWNLGHVDFCDSCVDAMASVAARGHVRRDVCERGIRSRRPRAERTSHAIAMHGEPAWGPDFSHPTYANPAAPKGGQLVQGVLGTFDSLNPFIVRGLPAANLRGYIVESLLARGYDEPFTLYGLIARKRRDRRRARPSLHSPSIPPRVFPTAEPVTPDDVIFSWQLLRDHGRPNFGIYYKKVRKAEAVGDARRAFRPLRRRRPRAAADHRPDAHAGPPRDRPGHVRGHELRAAARQRPV